MKYIVKTVFLLLSTLFIFYLLLPEPDFPKKLPDSFQSNEPADQETPLRRGYYTNFERTDVLDYYLRQYKNISFLNIKLPTYRLNYPPEEAQIIIRDQTRSTFLEEIVHPFRESIYVNGFKPKEDKDRILINDKRWLQKVTVRYVASGVFARFTVGLLSIALFIWIFKEYTRLIKDMYSQSKIIQKSHISSGIRD